MYGKSQNGVHGRFVTGGQKKGERPSRCWDQFKPSREAES